MIGHTLATTAILLPASFLAAQEASAIIPDDVRSAIEFCESSNNAKASNGTHFGLYQFDLPTWRSVGGSGSPTDASVAEQRARADTLYDSRGEQPWAASAACRARYDGPVMAETKVSTLAPDTHKTQTVQSCTVKKGDTLSKIAARNAMTWQSLYALNRDTIKNPNVIRVGWVLRLR